MQERHTVVVAAGPGPDPEIAPPVAALVIAADGGLDRCLSLGLRADVVVGDLDSVSVTVLADAEAAGTEILRHPARKNATDLELALDVALERGAHRVLIVASAEGRLDHLLASLMLLGHDRFAGVELDAYLGEATVHVVRGRRELCGTSGELVTLLAICGPAVGVTTEGLEYALAGETLDPGSSRGVSNVFAAPVARITLADGVLLAIRPGTGA